MSLRVRLEEYASLGGCIKKSFERDQNEIEKRFPRLDALFLSSFKVKLEQIEILEIGLDLTEEQKNVTTELYADADALNKELTVLKTFVIDAHLCVNAVSALIRNLTKGNIEGAIMKIKGVRQFVNDNQQALQKMGMDASFPEKLGVYKVHLSQKNAILNKMMNARKTIIDINKDKYAVLYSFIASVSYAGKFIFDGTTTKEDYSLSKIISKMRVPVNAVLAN